MAEWIEEDMSAEMSEESKKHFIMLRGRVHRMEALINSLLKFSRAGRTTIDIEKININSVVNTVLKRLAPASKYAIYFDSNFPLIMANYQDVDDVFYELARGAKRKGD